MAYELTAEQIQQVLQGISVPPQPQIMVDLQMEQVMPNPDLKSIAKLISQDPGLSGALLKIVNSPHFVWNPERVTFVPQYAKLAPSAGACYAEKMRRTAFAPARFKEQLRKGLNQLTYNIDNLFYFLPCSFLVPVHNGQIEIFRAGQPLFRLDEQEVGKARSEPLGVRLLHTVDAMENKSVWKPFRLYRRVPPSGQLSVTLALTGVGTAYFDDLKVEPLVPGSASAASPVAGQNRGGGRHATVVPAAYRPR